MGHTVRVEIVKCGGDLMRQHFGTIFRDRERSFLEVGEEISTIELLHNDVDVVLVLKDIKETDDMRVLTHLENLDLTTLQLDILH